MELRRYLGRNARDSHTAGLVIGAAAAVFNLVWLVAPPPIEGISYVQPRASGVLFFLVASLNAYVATRLVWWRLVPAEGEFSTRQAGGVGVGLGFFSMFTFSAIGLPVLYVLRTAVFRSGPPGATTDGLSAVLDPLGLLFLGLFGTVYGMVVTMWIPLSITTGGAVVLAHLENQYS